MSRITQQMLRKRSQHNDGCLTTLQQISLHQSQILKIQVLQSLCRHLKIIYLQNNIIQKLQNLSKLKQLQYLNVALNNISKIQNLQGCQSLNKLDMTVNFVDVMELYQSVRTLAGLQAFKEIYMTGNPCEDWKGCREYFIANIPTLQCYNGEVVTPSQRIKAKQNLPLLEKSLFQAIQARKLQLKKKQHQQQIRKQAQKYMTEQEKNQQKTGYTKQSRRQMYEQMYADKMRKQKQRNPQKFVQQKLSEMFTKDGEIRQCNQGRFKVLLKQYQQADFSIFSVFIPKHLQTSQLIVNINPHWVSIRVKKQLIQLKLTQQIIVSQSKTQRSQITGQLIIRMKKLRPQQFLRTIKEREREKVKKELEEKKLKDEEERSKRIRLCEQFQRKMEQEEDDIPDLQ